MQCCFSHSDDFILAFKFKSHLLKLSSQRHLKLLKSMKPLEADFIFHKLNLPSLLSLLQTNLLCREIVH